MTVLPATDAVKVLSSVASGRPTRSFSHKRYLIFTNHLADRNADPQRYTWHTKGEAILAKIQRAKEALANVN